MPFFEIPVALLSLKGVWHLLSPLLSDTGKDIFKEKVKGLLAKPSSEEKARDAVFGLLNQLEKFHQALEEFVQWLNTKAKPSSSLRQVDNQVGNIGTNLTEVLGCLDPQDWYQRQALLSQRPTSNFASMLKDFEKGMEGVNRRIGILDNKGRMAVYNPDFLDVLMRWQHMEFRLLARLPKMSPSQFVAVRAEAEENLNALSSAIDDFRKFIRAEIPFAKSF